MKETIDNWFDGLKQLHPEFYKRHISIILDYNTCKDVDEIKKHISKYATFYNRYTYTLIIPKGVYEDNLTKFEVV